MTVYLRVHSSGVRPALHDLEKIVCDNIIWETQIKFTQVFSISIVPINVLNNKYM